MSNEFIFSGNINQTFIRAQKWLPEEIICCFIESITLMEIINICLLLLMIEYSINKIVYTLFSLVEPYQTYLTDIFSNRELSDPVFLSS